MTLNDFATFSTAISGLAVTASLIYLALQTHQNAKHTRALIHQGRVANTLELTNMLLDPDIAALILRKNGRDATKEAVEDAQFVAISARQRFVWEDAFLQWRAGLLSADSFAATRARIAISLREPGHRAQWERAKVPGAPFTAFVDALLAATPPAEQRAPVDPL